jgi:hypothetical protein
MIHKILDHSRDYPGKHWEDIIILLTLLSVAAIHYFIYANMAFLDFFYLLIVLAGYYVGKRLAILGAFFANLMVWLFIFADQNPYTRPISTLDTHLDLTAWGGFLILAAWLVGTLSEKRKKELQATRHLCEELEWSNQRLIERNGQLENKLKSQLQSDLAGS